jgi:4-hydroxy-3-methylbut-2-en-1-yl diphosphate synthase IspG/GcpE
MKTGGIVLTICCLILMSCGDDKSTTETSATEITNQKNTITAKAIENFEYTDYALSSKADKATVNWKKYQELAIQISYLKKADLSFFNGDKQLLKTFIGEFRGTLPKQLRTNPVLSRSVIIETTLLKLNENLTIDNIDIRVKLRSIKDVLESFSNLNYQINKKVEFDIYDKIMPE